MNTHSPFWDDCQQLLQTLLTTKEMERVIIEAHKNIPGTDGSPTQLANIIDEVFPVTQPLWDFRINEGRECLRVYRQVLVTGFCAAAHSPTNYSKMSAVTQGQNESPVAYLEKLMDAYQCCTPLLVHGLVYRERERGFKTSAEKTFQNLPEVQDLLATSLLPQRVAVVHVSRAPKREFPRGRGKSSDGMSTGGARGPTGKA